MAMGPAEVIGNLRSILAGDSKPREESQHLAVLTILAIDGFNVSQKIT